MKYLISFLLLFFLSSLSFSQTNEEEEREEKKEKDKISVDLLRSPGSPAFTILGLQTTDIEKPTNPTDLIVSVRKASDNFSSFPNSYSLEFSPGWVFGGRNITYEDFKSTSIWDNIIQNSVFSFAISSEENETSIETTRVGVGVKISLLRGELDNEYGLKREKMKELNEQLDGILDLQSEFEKEAREEAIRNPLYIDIDKEIKDLINKIQQKGDIEQEILKIELQSLYQEKSEFLSNIVSEKRKSKKNELESKQKRLRELAEEVKFERHGFKLDISLAGSWNFDEQKFDKGELYNYGAWVTGAFDLNSKSKKNKVSILGTARLLYSPDEDYEINNTMMTDDNLRFDIGGRIVLDVFQNKLSLSGEALHRSVLNNDNIDNTHKLVFNLEYEVAKNRLLTLSLGRDFDGNFNTDGNLIAALNFVIGLGSKRPF